LLDRGAHREILDVRGNHAESDRRDDHDHRRHEEERDHRQAALRPCHASHLASRQRIPLPTRLNARFEMSSQLNQMKNALPRMWSSGTNPQYRLSSEKSRLSPIMK